MEDFSKTLVEFHDDVFLVVWENISEGAVVLVNSTTTDAGFSCDFDNGSVAVGFIKKDR